ncbi:MAG: hypothetical protein GX660_27900 [Clostridiaceae bacterium]|nr:hypothetical protein [Clostridiaceae bacterium]
MKHSFLIYIVFVFSLVNTYGQGDNLPKTKFTLGYFGETITHTGLIMGMEHYPFQSGKYQMILAADMGGYVHIRNNTSLFVRGKWGQRVTFGSGVFIDEFTGLGYLHHFTHGGDNYEVQPNGAVVKTPDSGSPMIMPSLALGTGYDFSKKTTVNMICYLRPELFWKAPFNGYYLTHFALNTGLIFKLSKKNEK